MAAVLLPQSYQYPNLSEGINSIGGLLHRDKECPFSGVTISGRVWRKVLESDARSVTLDSLESRHGVGTGVQMIIPSKSQKGGL